MKIICVARNYIDHAKELNNPVPTVPVIFLKPSTALLKGTDFYLPDFSADMHYECELVLRIGKNGKHISEQFALGYVDAISVGIDFTARDVQARQKEKGLPWEIAKAFDNSAVLGKWHQADAVLAGNAVRFALKKNGVLVQEGNSLDMIFSPAKQIAYASQFFTLQQGDLIYTGTPVGVGAVQTGDMLEGFLEDEKMFEVKVK
jgi:acylpyruvate hydrolase